jgi:hypothetical protein
VNSIARIAIFSYILANFEQLRAPVGSSRRGFSFVTVTTPKQEKCHRYGDELLHCHRFGDMFSPSPTRHPGKAGPDGEQRCPHFAPPQKT